MTSPDMLGGAARKAQAKVTSSSSSTIHEPKEIDILCGKETRARSHNGSRWFRLFVESYSKRYQEAKNKHKRGAITKEMYDTITQANIRFLKHSEESNGWVEISSTEARDKITHALRFAQKRSSRSSKTKRRSTPARQGSDSTHRSETSTTSATSFDLDQLLQQQQQHLASLSLSNSILGTSRTSHRSSFSSVGSASLLSKGSSSSRRSSIRSRQKVSFAATESTVCSTELSTVLSPSSAATKASAVVTTAPTESIPLPVDLSTTQHFDMHQSQTDLNVDRVDRPPKKPSRPTDEDEEEEEEYDDIAPLPLSDDGFDTIMDTNKTSGGYNMLDPLMETMKDSSDSSTEARKPPAKEEVGDDTQLADAIYADLINAMGGGSSLTTTPHQSSQMMTAGSMEWSGPVNRIQDSIHGGGGEGMTTPSLALIPESFVSGATLPSVTQSSDNYRVADGAARAVDLKDEGSGQAGDYSLLGLLQEPLMEWEELANTGNNNNNNQQDAVNPDCVG